MTSVSGPVRAKIANAFLGPLNVSDVICQTIASERNLSANTADTLALKADFQEGIAVIESIKATVANIAIQGKGESVSFLLHQISKDRSRYPMMV